MGPEETLSNAVKGLGAAKVCGSWTGMVGIKQQFTEGAGNSDQGDRVCGREQGLVETDVRVVESNGVGTEIRLVRGVDGVNEV